MMILRERQDRQNTLNGGNSVLCSMKLIKMISASVVLFTADYKALGFGAGLFEITPLLLVLFLSHPGIPGVTLCFCTGSYAGSCIVGIIESCQKCLTSTLNMLAMFIIMIHDNPYIYMGILCEQIWVNLP